MNRERNLFAIRRTPQEQLSFLQIYQLSLDILSYRFFRYSCGVQIITEPPGGVWMSRVWQHSIINHPINNTCAQNATNRYRIEALHESFCKQA